MPKNDMSLIMFKVLAYLYECMVNGMAVCMMLEDGGYTKGFKFASAWGGETIALSYSAKVTPEGFEYMKENKSMKKVYNYLKEAKGWIPLF